jgi:S1-C subfamily serine protease
MDKRSKILLISMALFTVATVSLAGWLFFLNDSPFRSNVFPLSGKEGNIRIYIQSPSSIYLGDDFGILITVQNSTDKVLTINEVRLPQDLLMVAVVEKIFPGTINQTGFDNDSTGFEINFMLAPQQEQTFEITLKPWQLADISGEITVVAENKRESSGFKINIKEKVADVPTLSASPTLTENPPITETMIPATATVVKIPYQSVVKIIAKVKHSSYLKAVWGGSGTIVSTDGLILTNAHLVSPSESFQADAYLIAISPSADRPPVETYYAEPVQIDRDLDLAILRIMLDINQKPVNWDELNLPAVPLGDANSLELGDTLTILGYPEIGGETITLVHGDVSGFTAEYEYGDRAFIKTSATIAAGTSGGMAIDQLGFLVAVPTQLGSGRGNELVDCRVLADTNGDGEIDEQDTCIPVGGFFNALRPINFAIPLIEASRENVQDIE